MIAVVGGPHQAAVLRDIADVTDLRGLDLQCPHHPGPQVLAHRPGRPRKNHESWGIAGGKEL